MNTVTYKNFYENPKKYLDNIILNEEVIILKNKKPAFKIIPLSSEDIVNPLKNSILYEGDILSPINDNWDSENANS